MSFITTRTCWRNWASPCRLMPEFSQEQFLALIKKARVAGITPIVQGVGDRNYPGAYILTQALLHKLGLNDYAKLFAGWL